MRLRLEKNMKNDHNVLSLNDTAFLLFCKPESQLGVVAASVLGGTEILLIAFNPLDESLHSCHSVTNEEYRTFVRQVRELLKGKSDRMSFRSEDYQISIKRIGDVFECGFSVFQRLAGSYEDLDPDFYFEKSVNFGYRAVTKERIRNFAFEKGEIPDGFERFLPA